MKKFRLFTFLSLIAMLFFSVSCEGLEGLGGDKDDDGNGGTPSDTTEVGGGTTTDTTGMGSGSGSLLTPDESKLALEQIGLELTGYFEAAQFEKVPDAINEIDAALKDCDELPSELTSAIDKFADDLNAAEFDTFEDYLSPSNPLYFNYADYYGIYNYNSEDGVFNYTESSSELTINVKSESGTTTATFKASGDLISLADGRNGEIPSTMNVAITTACGDKFAVKFNISKLNYSTKSVDISVGVSMNDFRVYQSESLIGKDGAFSVDVYSGDKLLVSSSASTTGLSFDYDASTEEGEAAIPTKTLGSINILNALLVKYSCDDVNTLSNDVWDLQDQYEHEFVYESEYFGTCYQWDYKEDYYKETSKLLSDKVVATWGFGTDDVQGSLAFDYYFDGFKEEIYDNDDYGASGSIGFEAGLVPLMVFDADDSRVDCEEFFSEGNFPKLSDMFDKMADDYDAIFDDLGLTEEVDSAVVDQPIRY